MTAHLCFEGLQMPHDKELRTLTVNISWILWLGGNFEWNLQEAVHFCNLRAQRLWEWSDVYGLHLGAGTKGAAPARPWAELRHESVICEVGMWASPRSLYPLFLPQVSQFSNHRSMVCPKAICPTWLLWEYKLLKALPLAMPCMQYTILAHRTIDKEKSKECSGGEDSFNLAWY